jgi:regulator of protease activity HflC (stomatin/prohibitin superfamily)
MSCCCFVTISTAEVGVIERFGKFTRYVFTIVVVATDVLLLRRTNERIPTFDEVDTNECGPASV